MGIGDWGFGVVGVGGGGGGPQTQQPTPNTHHTKKFYYI